MNYRKKIPIFIAITAALAGCDESDEQAPLSEPVIMEANEQAPISEPVNMSARLSGTINGLIASEKAVVTVSNGLELHSQTVGENGAFSFDGLKNDQNYLVKVHARGFKQEGAQRAIAGNNGHGISINMVEEMTPELNGKYHYVWEDDGQSVSGLEYSSAVNTPVTVVIDGHQQTIPNISAAQTLFTDYKIVLEDSDLSWTQAHAYRLLETMRQIPQQHCHQRQVSLGKPCDSEDLKLVKWILTKTEIAEDIAIAENGRDIIISEAAFSYSNPKIVTMDNQRGQFFSKRLHHAVVNYITKGGQDRTSANFILENRFGITIDSGKIDHPDSSFDELYQSLPVTGAQDRESSVWQPFMPKEVLTIINEFEEMPSGLHIIKDKNNSDKGLKYLLRRRNGYKHPLYPEAPAVAWPTAGYIEFMESAFNNSNLEHMQRLVLHEKSHFLWHYLLDIEMKLDWIELSDWFRIDGDEEIGYLTDEPYINDVDELASTQTHQGTFDPNNAEVYIDDSEGWSARKTTNFVSGYAQLSNPNEDFAESVSFFLNDPDKLKSRAPKKYEFIRDRLMGGVVYLQSIRDDLTFEVLNLYPDYIYPGKIKKVEINVDGYGYEEKNVTVDLELHTTKKPCAVEGQCLEGASYAYTRIFSDADTQKDIRFYPIEGQKISNKLRATFTLPATAKQGWWKPAQVIVTDNHGNDRYQRSTDFGWLLFIHNPDDDTIAPEYIPESLELSLGELKRQGSHTTQTLSAVWEVKEETGMSSDGDACYARFAHENFEAYSVGKYGDYYPGIGGFGQCRVDLETTEFFRSGKYRISYLNMKDQSLNVSRSEFFDENPFYPSSPTVTLIASERKEDIQSPEIELASCKQVSTGTPCIGIIATPTSLSKQNGETNVELTYWARDDASGLGKVSFKLRDPQGKEHFEYAYHENTRTLFFKGDPQSWKEYKYEFVLPVGSAPGTWGISSLTVNDKAGNFKTYDFTETLIFVAE